MPDIDYIRGEIERMRVQVGRERKEILQLQRAGIPTASADALLQRTLDKVDGHPARRFQRLCERPGCTTWSDGRSARATYVQASLLINNH